MTIRVASRQLCGLPGIWARTPSPPVASCCRKDAIPIPSSLRVQMRASSSLSWRLPSHEVPCHLSEDSIGGTQSDLRDRAIFRSGGRMDQPLPRPPICPPPFQQDPLRLRAQPVALRALVGERPSHQRHLGGRPHGRSRRNVVSEIAAAAGVVETVNRRFKELWENRSLVFPQLRQFSTTLFRPTFAL